MPKERDPQLAYSEIQEKMSDESSRRLKSAKVMSVLNHYLGNSWPPDSTLVDVGCSLGWTVEAAAELGARSIGVDIDVPGLAHARRDRSDRCEFACADGTRLPFRDESVEVVVFNHIYEHVVDPDAVMDEIRRVLKPTGVVYLGLGNRLGIVEPHYRLPFLSWLPRPMADRYVRAMKRGKEYYEQFRTVPGLHKMAHDLDVYDYSYSILSHPDAFAATDLIGGRASRLVRRAPSAMRTGARVVLPTFIWIGTKSPRPPAGQQLSVPPRHFAARRGTH